MCRGRVRPFGSSIMVFAELSTSQKGGVPAELAVWLCLSCFTVNFRFGVDDLDHYIGGCFFLRGTCVLPTVLSLCSVCGWRGQFNCCQPCRCLGESFVNILLKSFAFLFFPFGFFSIRLLLCSVIPSQHPASASNQLCTCTIIMPVLLPFMLARTQPRMVMSATNVPPTAVFAATHWQGLLRPRVVFGDADRIFISEKPMASLSDTAAVCICCHLVGAILDPNQHPLLALS